MKDMECLVNTLCMYSLSFFILNKNVFSVSQNNDSNMCWKCNEHKKKKKKSKIKKKRKKKKLQQKCTSTTK